MTRILVTVLVDDAFLGQFAEVVDRCADVGMAVQRQMTSIGVIYGTVDATRIDTLGHIQGVRHVEASRDVGLLGDTSED
ncbi:hypothetical protein CR159_04050 [Pollutimonas subterranea]|uniref:Uncharacterized protein n=1 Tax=Pollutimonas subterranea TaxID=2045210 RepID=A0A2N4U8S1_9BURK|nr:hypothetical protein [Pollutimonas subterranea]PLC51398.1 hypothetical protein CR159_04050 [Pollutimonas subterranea]